MTRSTRKSLADQAASAARKVIGRRTKDADEASAPATKAAQKPAAKKSASTKSAASSTAAPKKAAPRKAAPRKAAPKKAAPKKAAPKAPATKAASVTAKKAAPKAAKKAAPKAAKKAAPKAAAEKKTAPKKPAPTKAAAKPAAATKAAPSRSTAATSAPAKKQAPGSAPTSAQKPARKTAQRPVAKTTQKPAARKAPPSTLAVKPGEGSWTKSELAEVLAELREQRAHSAGILAEQESELSGLMRDSGDGAGQDQADVGATSFERDYELTVLTHERDKLAQIDRALERIDDGTYGVCESCGQPIGKMRLMAFPRATLCMTCKQREERR